MITSSVVVYHARWQKYSINYESTVLPRLYCSQTRSINGTRQLLERYASADRRQIIQSGMQQPNVRLWQHNFCWRTYDNYIGTITTGSRRVRRICRTWHSAARHQRLNYITRNCRTIYPCEEKGNFSQFVVGRPFENGPPINKSNWKIHG
jgi:hypothetical protein